MCLSGCVRDLATLRPACVCVRSCVCSTCDMWLRGWRSRGLRVAVSWGSPSLYMPRKWALSALNIKIKGESPQQSMLPISTGRWDDSKAGRHEMRCCLYIISELISNRKCIIHAISCRTSIHLSSFSACSLFWLRLQLFCLKQIEKYPVPWHDWSSCNTNSPTNPEICSPFIRLFHLHWRVTNSSSIFGCANDLQGLCSAPKSML